MTPEARKHLEDAAPDLYAACLVLLAVLDDPYADRVAAVATARAAVAKAKVGPLAARLLRRRRTIEGIEAARAKGVRIGRPPFVLTPARRTLLAIWRGGEPRDPLRVLAQALGCSIAKASELARREG